MSFFSRLFGMNTMEIDDGYESPAEIEAAKELAAFNRTTGKLAGDTVVRVISSLKDGVFILGWIDPHYYDPIAVRISKTTGLEEWAFADDVDKIFNDTTWNSDFDKNELARDVLEILNKHKSALFRVIQAPVIQENSLRPSL